MLKRTPIALLGIFAAAILYQGCYYDNEEDLYPVGVCDTASVTYEATVAPIISSKCFDCHSNSTAAISGNGFSWEGYANLSGYLANNAETYIGSINHEAGFPVMPENRPKLSDCEIRKIEIWVEAGFPDN